MALVFPGKTECAICGKILQRDDEIVAMSPLSNTSHPLSKYFDAGLHKSCYKNWDKKEEAENLLKQEGRI